MQDGEVLLVTCDSHIKTFEAVDENLESKGSKSRRQSTGQPLWLSTEAKVF